MIQKNMWYVKSALYIIVQRILLELENFNESYNAIRKVTFAVKCVPFLQLHTENNNRKNKVSKRNSDGVLTSWGLKLFKHKSRKKGKHLYTWRQNIQTSLWMNNTNHSSLPIITSSSIEEVPNVGGTGSSVQRGQGENNYKYALSCH